MLTNHELLNVIAEERKHTFISTGMSTMEQIKDAVIEMDKRLKGVWKETEEDILDKYPSDWTDYYTYNYGRETPYAEEIYNILTPVIQTFANDLGEDFNNIKLRHMWTQMYERGRGMVSHNHGPIGYSANLLIDFNEINKASVPLPTANPYFKLFSLINRFSNLSNSFPKKI